jgi:hypothetical protein
MHRRLAYLCDYCEKLSLYLAAMKRHEKRCLFNPVLKACRSCRWWFKNRPVYGTRIPGDTREFLPFCGNLEEDYSLEVERGYGEYPDFEYNVARTGCMGWAAMKTWEINKRARLKAEAEERREAAWDEGLF